MNQQSNSTYFTFEETVKTQYTGLRIDAFLAEKFPAFSRGRWQIAIKNGDILINNTRPKAHARITVGDHISGKITYQQENDDIPQNISLDVRYFDDSIIIINKPAGLVVHPAVGNPDKTLLNALLYHFPKTQYLPRGGIVHRLDKDTSGVLVVAHSLQAHTHLITQLHCREMGREYLALVHRQVTAGATVEQPIGRHPHNRLMMAVRPDGKPAITHYRISKRFGETTLLRVNLETGRTHQIRVHMAFIRHPLVGDALYTRNIALSAQTPAEVRERLSAFPRQALHAKQLTLTHPTTGKRMVFSVPMPADMAELIAYLSHTYSDSSS